MIKLLLKEIKDLYIRENFQNLQDFLRDQGILKPEWKLVTLDFTDDIVLGEYKHGLGYIPTDLIQTFQTGTGTITWNYSRFTRDALVFTAAGTDPSNPLVVRALVGSYRENGNG